MTTDIEKMLADRVDTLQRMQKMQEAVELMMNGAALITAGGADGLQEAIEEDGMAQIIVTGINDLCEVIRMLLRMNIGTLEDYHSTQDALIEIRNMAARLQEKE